MSIKAKVEAIIYAAEEPVTVEQILAVLKEGLPADEPVQGETPALPLKDQVHEAIEQLVSEYTTGDRGMEIRQIAGGYRMATKPEHHDVVRGFAKTLKPPVRLSLQALETLAVIAYKQPVTAPEISEIRGVESGGVIGTLLDRKLITTAGRKAVIGRPILYRTSKEFLLRFGLKDITELPSLEEFEKLAVESEGLFEGPHAENGKPVPGPPPPVDEHEAPEPLPSAAPEAVSAGEASSPLLGRPAENAKQVEDVPAEPAAGDSGSEPAAKTAGDASISTS